MHLMQELRTGVPEEGTAELKVPGFWAVLDEGCIQAKIHSTEGTVGGEGLRQSLLLI